MTVISTSFAPLARVVAEGVGAPWLPIIVVPHPVGDPDEAVIRSKGENAAQQCVRVLTTPASELEQEYRDKAYPLPEAMMPR